MYMYVRKYVCMYASMLECMYVCMYACMYVRMRSLLKILEYLAGEFISLCQIPD